MRKKKYNCYTFKFGATLAFKVVNSMVAPYWESPQKYRESYLVRARKLSALPYQAYNVDTSRKTRKYLPFLYLGNRKTGSDDQHIQWV